MSNSLFSFAFNEIFEDCRPFVLNDFNGIKGQKADNNNGTIKNNILNINNFNLFKGILPIVLPVLPLTATYLNTFLS